MLSLSLNDPSDAYTGGHVEALADPITGRDLEELRDKLVQFSYDRRIDISEEFNDQFYAARPWKLDKGESAPVVREPLPKLLLEMAGTIFRISPGRLSLSGHAD